MTPERQEWWDSLPAEEKRVRKNIKSERKPIKAAKKALRVYHELDDYVYKKIICENKQIIKALRKQIAMCPQVVRFSDVLVRQPRLKCPCCSHRFILHTPYCNRCGQKLRWE